MSEVYLVLGCLHWLEMDHRDLTVKNVHWGLLYRSTLEVYAAGLREHAVYEATIDRHTLCVLFLGLLPEVERKAERIDWQFGLSSINLKNGGKKALWEEEGRYPIHSRLLD